MQTLVFNRQISSSLYCSIHFPSLRDPLIHPRPDLGYPRVDLFERGAQRGQRL